LLDCNAPRPKYIFDFTEDWEPYSYYNLEMWKGVKWADSLMKFCAVWGGDAWNPVIMYEERRVEALCDLLESVQCKDTEASEPRYKARDFNFVGLGSYDERKN
jgi:hypothetical protein